MSSPRRPATTKSAESTVESTENVVVEDCCSPCFAIRHPNCMAKFADTTPHGRRVLRARTIALRICTHKAFEYTILAFIFASSISLVSFKAGTREND